MRIAHGYGDLASTIAVRFAPTASYTWAMRAGLERANGVVGQPCLVEDTGHQSLAAVHRHWPHDAALHFQGRQRDCGEDRRRGPNSGTGSSTMGRSRAMVLDDIVFLEQAELTAADRADGTQMIVLTARRFRSANTGAQVGARRNLTASRHRRLEAVGRGNTSGRTQQANAAPEWFRERSQSAACHKPVVSARNALHIHSMRGSARAVARGELCCASRTRTTQQAKRCARVGVAALGVGVRGRPIVWQSARDVLRCTSSRHRDADEGARSR